MQLIRRIFLLYLNNAFVLFKLIFRLYKYNLKNYFRKKGEIMSKNSQLRAGAILSYISLGLTSFISILYTPIMLRFLGQSEYGLFNLSNSIIGYLGVLDLGLGNAVIRYTAKYRAIEDKEGEENLHGMFVVVYAILSLITFIIGFTFVSNIECFFSSTLSSEEIYRIKIILAIMIFNLAISFPFGVFSGIINAYEHFVFPKILAIIRAILNPLVMIPLLLMGYKSIGMTVATTVVNIIFIIINVYYCFKILKIRIKLKKIDFGVLKEISSYSFFIFLNILVDKIYWSTDQFILGAVSGTVAVAIYSVGSSMNTYYMSFSNAISGVFLPKITRMVTKNSSDEDLSNLFIKSGRIQFIIMSFILGGFILVGREFIKVWAGNEYYESFYIALVVMIPLTVPLIQNIGISILQAKNMHKFRSKVYILIAIINIFLSIPLAKIYGGFGAAITTAFSMIVGNIIIINIYYYKKININIPLFWKNILIMSFPVTISIILSKGLLKYIYLTGYLGICIKGTIYSIIFFGLVWIFGMNKYEKNLILSPLNKVKKFCQGGKVA